VPLSIRLFISAARAKYDSGTKTRTPPPRAPPIMFWSEHPRQSTANLRHLGDSAAGRRCSHHRSGRVELNLRCRGWVRCPFLVLGEAPAASLGIAKCRCCAIGSLPPPLLLQAQ